MQSINKGETRTKSRTRGEEVGLSEDVGGRGIKEERVLSALQRETRKYI